MGFSVKHIQAILLVVLTLLSSGMVDAGIRSVTADAANKSYAKRTVKLSSGTPVSLRLIETVDSNQVTVGTTVNFSVVSDVKADDDILVKAGTMGQAQVIKAEKNGMIGQPGEITISDFYTTAVDGSRVPLMATLTQEGKDKMVLSLVGTVICLFPILLKGGKAVIPAGTQKTVYTAGEVSVKL
jgi:hypothetical protein